MKILVLALVCSLLVAQVKLEDDEWLDPYDMLDYDATTKTMRKPAEERTNFNNVPTRRREHVPDTTECSSRVEELRRELEEQKKIITAVSQKPSCNPVFKRFLIKLLKEIERVGLPSDPASVLHYDAKVKLSRQALAEISQLLADMDAWRTGPLDHALSEVLVDLKPHDVEAWRWHFEDTFGVEIDTVVKMCVVVLIIVVVICSELWSAVSWFVQFRRVFAICFFISIAWNWFYLYKIAFAEHQSNIVKMERVNEKCTGMKQIDWSDNLKEWFRSTWTLQDDPCKRYYEVLMVNPILLVPPTKAISVTITTFITEPAKHVGQAISEFLRALLKDLPITLQIPVLLTIVLSILVFLYGSVQAAFQHGLMGRRRDPPPPAVDPPERQPAPLRGRGYDEPARGGEGDAIRHAIAPTPRRPADPRPDRNPVRQRPRWSRQEPRVAVETLGRNAGPYFRGDEADAAQGGREGDSDPEQFDCRSDEEDCDPPPPRPAPRPADRAQRTQTQQPGPARTRQHRTEDQTGALGRRRVEDAERPDAGRDCDPPTSAAVVQNGRAGKEASSVGDGRAEKKASSVVDGRAEDETSSVDAGGAAVGGGAAEGGAAEGGVAGGCRATALPQVRDRVDGWPSPPGTPPGSDTREDASASPPAPQTQGDVAEELLSTRSGEPGPSELEARQPVEETQPETLYSGLTVEEPETLYSRGMLA